MRESDEQVRQLVEGKLRRQVPDGLWNYLIDKNFVSTYRQGECALDELLTDVRELLQAFTASSRPSTPGPVGGPPLPRAPTERYLSEETSTYQAALSEAVASVANTDPDVAAFRDKVLGGRLLQWDEVEPWVQSQQAAQNGPTTWLTFPLPPDHDGKSVAYDELLERADVGSRLLKYVVRAELNADDSESASKGAAPSQKVVATAVNGPLERLRWLSESLATVHAWQEGQATVFVLTGLTPTVSMIRTTQGGHYGRHGWNCAWAERIVLTVDPAAPVEEIVAAYRAARRQYTQRRTQGKHGIRTQSLRQLRLVEFVASRRPQIKWNDLMQAWNDRCEPGERYTQCSNFRRDARLAQERLLYRGMVALRHQAW